MVYPRAFPFLALFLLAMPAWGQVPRVRADANPPVEDLFKAPSIITIQSVTGLPARNLNVTIHHAFARVNAGAKGLFGLDGPANIRIGIDIGLTDWLSVGVGRSRFDRQYDLRSKITVLRQRQNDSMPVQVAVTGNAAITTVSSEEMDFVDRMSYGGALLIARRFSDRVSLQVAPMIGHANTVFVQRAPNGILTPENTVFAVGLGAQVQVSSYFSLLAEYVPVVGPRSDGTANAMAVGLAIDTGGHVFQLFMSGSPYAVEQQTIGQNSDNFFDGDIRLGFTVNRVFGL
ncbi:MAG: hypothetical protein IIC18_02680 [Bacteroidetes bacterium]|nr:hypothetical protein [Bacteroidota bacterium]